MKTKIKSKFKPTGMGNLVYRGKGFYVSYRAEMIDNPIDNLVNMFTQTESRIGKDETALSAGGVWRVLNGDFRKDYEKCTTLAQSLKVYEKHKDKYRSVFSTD